MNQFSGYLVTTLCSLVLHGLSLFAPVSDPLQLPDTPAPAPIQILFKSISSKAVSVPVASTAAETLTPEPELATVSDEPVVTDLPPITENPLPTIAEAENLTAIDTSDPVLSFQPTPRYPKLAIANCWEGDVILDVTVAAKGHVESIDVAISSGRAILDKAAIRAVSRWKYEPQGTSSHIQLPIEFTLDPNATSCGHPAQVVSNP